MSIGRDEFEKLLNAQVSRMGIDEFERMWIRHQYQQRFNVLFPEYAPEAWKSLLELVPLVAKTLEDISEEEAERLDERIKLKVLGWVKKFNSKETSSPFSAEAVWFLATARVTLDVAAFAKLMGGPPPTTFLSIADMGVTKGEGGELQPYVDTGLLQLTEIAIVRLGSGIEVWDQSKEDPRTFRSRILAEYGKRLDEQIAQVDTQITPGSISVEDREVIFLIERRFGGMTGYAINKKHFDGRDHHKTVREGIRKVQGILFS